MMPQWAGSTIVRTRNLEELAKCDMVIDVGAVYDHATMRYDHHQRTFSSVLSEVHPDVETTARVAGQRCPSGLTGRAALRRGSWSKPVPPSSRHRSTPTSARLTNYYLTLILTC